jgi:aminoglycoside N3'-acetyltransferase
MFTDESSKQELTIVEVSSQIRTLGVPSGGILLVHTSFRAVRPIKGGPLGLIEALLAAVGPEGTLMMPSWTGDDDEVFNPLVTPASRDLGVVADVFWRLPGVVRSNHPFALAASGPQGLRITCGEIYIPPHAPGSPIGRVYELNGQVLLLGVGHDADTTLHLAELLAGVPYRLPKHCTVMQGGTTVRLDYLENDHCCARFALMDDWLRTRGLQSEGSLGHGHARLANAQQIVRIAREYLSRDPFVFLHGPETGCVDCNEARKSIFPHRTTPAITRHNLSYAPPFEQTPRSAICGSSPVPRHSGVLCRARAS